LVFNFSESVKAGSGNLQIFTSAGVLARTIAVTDTAQVTFSGSTMTVNPSTDLSAGTSYYILMGSGAVVDLAGNAYAGISNATTLNFTVSAPTYVLSANASSYNEGSTAFFTLTTTGVADGTALGYTLSGISVADVLAGSSLSGNLIVNSNSASLGVILLADGVTEGPETLRVSITGTSATASTVVNDTSVAGGATSGNDMLRGTTANDVINGLAGTDTVTYTSSIAQYALSKSGTSVVVRDVRGTDGTDTLISIERLKFTDKTVNLTIQSEATSVPTADVNRLTELYVAFFNRVPDADGLEYWIGQFKNGQTIKSIADSFYSAGLNYSSLTGYTAGMNNADFVNVVYRNVLGRTGGADAEGLAYWTTELASGRESRGSLVSSILTAAHNFKGDATWGWVANLLDNKVAVARTFAIDSGLGYLTPEESISQGMAIAAAVTSTGTAAAVALMGVDLANLNLAVA
jgi:Bacterial Ig-like domain/Domain of unknown function (DUF4214)